VLATLFGLVVLAPSLPAGSKQATGRLAQARYVALGYDLGDRFLSERQAIVDSDRVTPEDRRALEVIRELLEDWDRYESRVSEGSTFTVLLPAASEEAGAS